MQDEAAGALAAPEHFERGPINLGKRATADDPSAAFIVEDGRYISARWPGDAYEFSQRLLAQLAEGPRSST